MGHTAGWRRLSGSKSFSQGGSPTPGVCGGNECGPEGRSFPRIPGLPRTQNALLQVHYVHLGGIKVLQGIQAEGLFMYAVRYVP